ncbi:MAG TPA: hypothetical protein IAC03_06475 [Candidatus Coprenecus pullistercoris]|nr:hypothetical protein [Candidatus Coprenecus pullistercoris]
MKKLSFIAVLSFMAALSLFMSCEEREGVEPADREQLPTPVLRVAAQDTSSFTISWDMVAGAGMYECESGGEVRLVKDTAVVYTGLAPDSTYVVSVRSMPSDTMLFQPSWWEEIQVVLKSAGPEYDNDKNYIGEGPMFTIEYEPEDSRRMLHCYVYPDDPEMYYFRETFDDEYFDLLGGNAVDVWTAAKESYEMQFGSEAFNMLAMHGDDYWQVEYEYEEHLYILVAGVNMNLERITDMSMQVFYAGTVPESDMTFEVDFRDVTSSGAVAYITPSTDTESYSVLMLESSAISDYSQEDLLELVKVGYKDYIEDGRVYSGEMSMTYRDGTLDPGTSYTLLVFGWNTLPSTEIFKFEFTTGTPSSSEGMTFDFNVLGVHPYEITVRIVPSKDDARYLCFPMPLADYELYKEDLPQYVYDICSNSMNPITVVQYLDMFGMIGEKEMVFDWFDHGIEPGVSYMLWAVGTDVDGEDVIFYEPTVYPDAITTPAE